ncbi:MAG: PEGA domain-containing protein, partial [bacterium]
NVSNPSSPGASIYSGTFTKSTSFLFPWDSSFTTTSGQKIDLTSPVALRIRNTTKKPVSISIKVSVNEAVGGLVVNSNPSGATVYLDNQSIGNTPIVLSNIKTGSHILRLNYPGYGDRQRTIIIRPHQYEYVMETFMPQVNMGSLYIDSAPRGASLYLDDSYQGETPLRIDFVPIGVHTIRLSKDGYRDYVQQVFIENNKTTTIFVNLVVETTRFRLSINSNPSGASVYIDGIYRGTTPTYNYVSYGFHTVRLVLEGYKDYETSIRVTEDATFNFSLERAEGALVVFSNPPNAEVYIDGAYYGKTPITIQRLSVGRKTVLLKLSGYADWTDDVNITEGEIAQINATLKLAGTLQVSSSINGAKVYLDGKEIGVTPFTSSNIPEGTHNLSIELFGYKTWEGIVEVYPRQTTNIFAKLEVAPLSISEIKINPQPYRVKTLFKRDLDISFHISKKAQVTVEIRDMNNNLIATPLSNFKASVPDIHI